MSILAIGLQSTLVAIREPKRIFLKHHPFGGNSGDSLGGVQATQGIMDLNSVGMVVSTVGEV